MRMHCKVKNEIYLLHNNLTWKPDNDNMPSILEDNTDYSKNDQ